MSYILDALKKAEAEREHGQVPGLHTPAAHVDTEDGPVTRPPPPWVMGLGAAMVLVALVAMWAWTRPAPEALTPPPLTAPLDVQTAGAVPQPVAPSPALQPESPSIPAPRVAVAEVETAMPAAPPPKTSASPAPQRAEAAAPVRVEAPKAVPREGRSPPAPVHVDPAPAPDRDAKVPTLAELPEEVRRSLPPLSVSGAMYSDHPASRMLLINNRVFHEGDQPSPGLVLEEIRLKSAVLRYRGTRYAVSY